MIKPLTVPPKKLAQSILSTDMTFIPNNIIGWDGEDLTTADFGTTCYIVLKNSTNTLIEIAEIDVTTIASPSITFLTRGLPYDGGLVSVTTNALDWAANDTSIMFGTDAPQLWEALKNYIDTVALQGVPDASISVKGAAKISIAPGANIGNPTISIASPAVITLNSHGLVAGDTIKFSTTGALPTGITAGTTYYVISAGLSANTFEISTSSGGSAIVTTGSQSGTHTLINLTPIAAGINDPRIINQYVVDTGLTNAYVITPNPGITAYAAGQIFTFKAANANSGASTLNVNGLGVKNIKKSVSSDLTTGDIPLNGIILVEYDGTNFQLLITQPGVPVIDIQTFIAGGTWTMPSGAKMIKVIGVGGGGGGGATSTTTTGPLLGGGGGGSGFDYSILASMISSPVTITIGAGGAGGIASSNTAPSAGGNSSFGSYFTFYGGGCSANAAGSNATGGGGGGGVKSAGSNASGATGGTGGNPLGATSGANDSTFGGGAGGLGSSTTGSTLGGGSIYGGGGGGGGGGTADNGGSSIYGAGGGGGGSLTAGGVGGTSVFAGAGGIGGSNAAGGNGVFPGGGGGGAGSNSATFKNGGAGAGGQIIVISYF